jgi:hypothetical protein
MQVFDLAVNQDGLRQLPIFQSNPIPSLHPASGLSTTLFNGKTQKGITVIIIIVD